MSASYDLYPQYCLLPNVTQEEHAIELLDELATLIKQLPTATKQKILCTIATAIKLMAATLPYSPQRAENVPTSKGEETIERMQNAPPITTTNNPTKLRNLKAPPTNAQA